MLNALVPRSLKRIAKKGTPAKGRETKRWTGPTPTTRRDQVLLFVKNMLRTIALNVYKLIIIIMRVRVLEDTSTDETLTLSTH